MCVWNCVSMCTCICIIMHERLRFCIHAVGHMLKARGDKSDVMVRSTSEMKFQLKKNPGGVGDAGPIYLCVPNAALEELVDTVVDGSSTLPTGFARLAWPSAPRLPAPPLPASTDRKINARQCGGRPPGALFYFVRGMFNKSGPLR